MRWKHSLAMNRAKYCIICYNYFGKCHKKNIQWIYSLFRKMKFTLLFVDRILILELCIYRERERERNISLISILYHQNDIFIHLRTNENENQNEMSLIEYIKWNSLLCTQLNIYLYIFIHWTYSKHFEYTSCLHATRGQNCRTTV